MKRIFLIITILIYVFSISGKEWRVEDVPNVHISDRNRYVSDPENLLSPGVRNSIDSRLRALTDSTSAEFAVVLLPSTGDVPIEDFAQELGEKWGVGKKDKSNGLLLLLVMDQRAARIHTGYGMEGILPDITSRKIIDKYLIPAMRAGDTDKAVSSTVGVIAEIVENPENASEIASDMQEDKMRSVDPKAFRILLGYIVGLLFAGATALFILDIRKSRKRKSNYDKSLVWKNHLWIYVILGVFSLGSALIYAILDIILYRWMRTRRIKCDTCGAKMHRLSEEEDNKLLTPGEDLEERLNTVDYDVWECPDCGTIEKFPYYRQQNEYKACPRCGTIAYKLAYDRITRQPTYTTSGMGSRVYQCMHCGYTHSDDYHIPRKDRAAEAAALGIIAGMASGSRGGGGGGFSGGSFGGGSFGGGGATGRW